MSEFIKCKKHNETGSSIYMRKSEIAAYTEYQGGTYIWLKGMSEEFIVLDSVSELSTKVNEVRG